MENTAITSGVHHIGLTVPDITATGAFFTDVLGFERVGEKPGYPAVFVSDGVVMLTLWQVKVGATARPFDRASGVGLHHLALTVRADALEALHDRLATADGVDVEFAPEALGSGGTRHMMCYVPGGIRVEFIAPATN